MAAPPLKSAVETCHIVTLFRRGAMSVRWRPSRSGAHPLVDACRHRRDHSALTQSQNEKERYHRTAVLRLQQRYTSAQQKLDCAYEDRLSGRISEEFWTRKAPEVEAELGAIRRELARHETASHDYTVSGLQILELARTAPEAFISQTSAERRKLLDLVLSNCEYERGTLRPTYRKPFDLLVRANENEDWLGVRDDFRNWLIRAA